MTDNMIVLQCLVFGIHNECLPDAQVGLTSQGSVFFIVPKHNPEKVLTQKIHDEASCRAVVLA